MRVDAFSYELPPELIAQRPREEREAAKLMHLDASGNRDDARTIAELPSLLPVGALVVLNDTRVIPARLLGKKSETGGRVEIFLVRRVGTRAITVDHGEPKSDSAESSGSPPHALETTETTDAAHATPATHESMPTPKRKVEVWRALGKASKPLRFGADVIIGDDRLFVRLLGRSDDDGLLEIALWTTSGESVADAVRACGHVPLPPYIKRDDDEADAHRYQTIFARVEGAIAAPTAGLHLTRALLGRLAVRGCEVATITLHVGLGTFQPVAVDDLDAHPMHAESFRVSRTTADSIARARERGSPVVAIGTTVARALESAADPERPGLVRPTESDTRLLIQPGYAFKVVDMLLTNFHLPRSTLLAMVCAFAGTERVLAAYRAAVRAGWRFFSYGDAMLLHRAAPDTSAAAPSERAPS